MTDESAMHEALEHIQNALEGEHKYIRDWKDYVDTHRVPQEVKDLIDTLYEKSDGEPRFSFVSEDYINDIGGNYYDSQMFVFDDNAWYFCFLDIDNYDNDIARAYYPKEFDYDDY